jgi:hypothetical protein
MIIRGMPDGKILLHVTNHALMRVRPANAAFHMWGHEEKLDAQIVRG